MAKQRNSKPPRRRDKPGAGGGRRKPCLFCKDKVEYADYKDVATLGRYTSERGRIRARRITGLCRRHQSQVATAVKRAREQAALESQGLALQLSNTVLTIARQAGDDGRLFGSVTNQDIAEAIKEARGVDVDRRKNEL